MHKTVSNNHPINYDKVEKRIYVVWTNLLFLDLVRLLLKHPEIVFIGETSDEETAVQEIFKLEPGVVLVEEADQWGDEQVLNLLKLCAWDVQIILVRMDDNRLNVFSHSEKLISQANDLLLLVGKQQDTLKREGFGG